MLKLRPATQYSKGRSKPWGGSKLVNCFAEQTNGDQQDMFQVMLIPGSTLFSTIDANNPIRGVHVMGTTLYVVCGTTLYSVTSGGVAATLGTITGTDKVRMADNGTELAIAASRVGYVLSGGSVSTPANIGAVSDVAYIDGYILWTRDSSAQFVISALNDALTYDAADIATVEGSPDNLVGVMVDHREVQFYGKKSIEIWYNSGAADFPFERQGNAFIERGCFSRDTIIKIDNSVHFLGDDKIVYRLDGYSPIRISTHAVEYAIRNATSAWASTYTMEGHKFYALGTEDCTWTLDMSTGLWHERKSDGLDNWRMHFAERVYDQVIFGDGVTGKLYTASLDTYTENSSTISMQIEIPIIESGDRIERTMYAFELLCETGVGLNSGQGSDPQAMLQYSDDGGRTWSNELWRSMGGIGSYRTRCVWRKLGQFRQRQMKLSITDPVRRVALGYYADIR